MPTEKLVSLYFSFIYPYLHYCNLVWGGTFHSHLFPLFKLQKRALRVISKVGYREHTTPLFIQHNLLKLDDIHKLQLGIFMYKMEFDETYIRSHSHFTRNRSDLNPSYARLTSTQKSLSFSAVNFWNQLPDFVTNSQSLPIFKTKLKKFLLDSYA